MGMSDLRGPDRSSTTNFLQSFCSDYKIWNDHSFAISCLSSKLWSETANSDYLAFLKPFVERDTNIQLASCGSESTFDADRVSVGHMSQTINEIEVQFSVRSTVGDWSDDFVAVIILHPEMTLRQIFYIDPYPVNGMVRLPYL